MRSPFVLAFLLAATTLALAEPMEIRPKAPVATFDIPDSWETSRIARGIQAISSDKEVDLWVEAYKPDQFKAILAEHDAYWKEQGVEIAGRDSQSHKEGGQEVQMTTETATWNGKPTVLYYIEYNLGLASKSNIVVTYWASPEGDETFHREVGKILESLAVTEK
jgi:hypothetical protein